MDQKLVLLLWLEMDDKITYDFIDVEIPDFHPEFFSLWIRKVIGDFKRELGYLSYIFCSDEYLLNINKEYLDHDYYTDIITFNYNEGNSLSGDLFISWERIKDHADEMGVGFFDELCRVMVHGVLHLVGYNDKTDREQSLMTEMEDRMLSLRNSFT